jgi:hypothetical protein
MIAIILRKNFRQHNIMFPKLYQHHFAVIKQFFSLFGSLRTFFLNDFSVVQPQMFYDIERRARPFQLPNP